MPGAHICLFAELAQWPKWAGQQDQWEQMGALLGLEDCKANSHHQLRDLLMLYPKQWILGTILYSRFNKIKTY